MVVPKMGVISLLLYENKDNEIKRINLCFKHCPGLTRGSRKVTCTGAERQKGLGLIFWALPLSEKIILKGRITMVGDWREKDSSVISDFPDAVCLAITESWHHLGWKSEKAPQDPQVQLLFQHWHNLSPSLRKATNSLCPWWLWCYPMLR